MNDIINRKFGLINKLNKELNDLYHKIALHYGLSDSAFWILYELYDRKVPCTQKEICANWYYNKQTINSAIKSLEQQRFIHKGYKENSKTNKKIGLTEIGLKVCEKSIKEVMELENKVFSKINEKELDVTINLLQKTLLSLKEEVNKNLI